MIGASALEAALRRDRRVVAAALAVLTAVAWFYTLWLVAVMDMGTMAMQGMRMPASPFAAAMIPAVQPWSTTEFIVTFVMWAVMMVGMMTPSAAPMILLYARVGRQAAAQGKPLAATGWFATGYLFAWTAFSLLATMAQWGLDRALLLTPRMAGAYDTFGAAVLIAAGIYQWTPFKDACLKHCRAPMHFIQRHGGFRREARGSLELGFHHGVYCIGCCWALMALLFVGGVMNVLWIAGIAVFVLAEKVIPGGRAVPRIAGSLLIAAGLSLLL